MKFYIYTNRVSNDLLNRFGLILKKLYPSADIEVGKSKPTKMKQDKLDSELAYMLKAEDFVETSNLKTAVKIMDVTGVGVSESVLQKL